MVRDLLLIALLPIFATTPAIDSDSGGAESATTAILSVGSAMPLSLERSGRVDYQWPGGLEVVLREFDPPAERWLAGHRGVDLGFESDGVVLAPADGVVAFAGVVVDREVISIDHADGIRTTYEPVDSLVTAGDVVVAGQPIGYIESGHCLLGDCLHWGAKRGETYIDPLLLIDRVRVRLWPVDRVSPFE